MKLGDPCTPHSRPRRPVTAYDLRGRANATMQLIDGYKGWLLELISTMRDENASIERGLRLTLKRDDGTAWEDRTAAVLAANEQLLQRMESLIVAMEEEAEELANLEHGYPDYASVMRLNVRRTRPAHYGKAGRIGITKPRARPWDPNELFQAASVVPKGY